MKIYGLNKTTLLDYPGRVAATIFLGGCNFRCPFCQNSSLVLNPSSQPELSVTEVLSFLKKRQGILEGVCVTGGGRDPRSWISCKAGYQRYPS